ncbi:MAG TPA: hypothetical protein VHA56_10770 [Mucilaginibacter sp.]|nr:hypothetical protein [Mucilaginibacter sp.]
MGTEKPYILTWRELAEQALNWEDSGNWGDYDFEKLSELIYEKTNTRLSMSTLKRIWGKVKYDSKPTIITLNALARFLDFTDWRAFKKNADAERSTTAPDTSTPEIRISRMDKKRRNFFQPVAFTLIGGLVLYLLLSLVAKRQPVADKNASAKFESRVISDNMPNSVVFDYDASGFHADSVFIQQSWDPGRREQVAADGHQHTSIYYVPGYFNAKLIVDGKVKKEHPVFIKTKGWLGLIGKEPVPSYLNADSIRRDGTLGISPGSFARINGSPVFNGSWVYFYNVREFNGLNGDNFSFETTLRNTSTPEQSSCRKLEIEIMGSGNAISIPLSDKGCIAALGIYTGERFISGKETDLSAFGCDFSGFQRLGCAVNHHRLVISLNGKQIYESAVSQGIGKITGIRIAFEGAGEIKKVKLGDDDHVVYQEDFTSPTHR